MHRHIEEQATPRSAFERARLWLTFIVLLFAGSGAPAIGAAALHGRPLPDAEDNGNGTKSKSTPQADEYIVKAALLFKFATYTTWPKSSLPKKDSPLIIAVFGKDPFGATLERVLGKKSVGDHPVVLKRYKKVADALEAHILFLGETDSKTRDQLIKECRKRPIFLVGDKDGLARIGGMANFFFRDGKVKFAMNRETVKSNKLKLTQLLMLARIDKENKRVVINEDKKKK